MFLNLYVRKAISPEQSPFDAFHALRDEFSVGPGLDVQLHNRFGVRTAQIEALLAHVEAQAVHFIDEYGFGFKL
jgi:hypothetical protein